MDEKIKSKDAEPAKPEGETEELNEGLEDTFPASDPVSATRHPSPEGKGEPEKR